ncbi:hypothetical protein HanIR_Chr10g0485731 [Helianthus annuus]|nr:hypothetical protein HanIR_Chr10g0485731 [Helianthus annuus]
MIHTSGAVNKLRQLARHTYFTPRAQLISSTDLLASSFKRIPTLGFHNYFLKGRKAAMTLTEVMLSWYLQNKSI